MVAVESLKNAQKYQQMPNEEACTHTQLHHRIAQFWRGQIAFQLHNQVGLDFNIQFARHGHDAVPAIVGIRAERLAAHERDVAVPEL